MSVMRVSFSVRLMTVVCCFLVSCTFPLPLILEGRIQITKEAPSSTHSSSFPTASRAPLHLSPPFSTDFPPPVNDTVIIENGSLKIRGKDVYLYGGELQYFRIRDENFDANATWVKWGKTLDLMKDAGMNFVSFYIPWDYHEETEGNFNFHGAKDVGRLLDLCYEKEFHVLVRPGPFIIAEWPTGPGSFGAVPQWFKDKFPDTLWRKSDGSTHPQPTYHHPVFLNYTERWFARIAPILKKYIYEKPCISMVQLDNEPNFLWEDHYTFDYSDPMKDYYHNYLERKYGDISALNSDYSSDFHSFDEIEPPTGKPDETSDNPMSWDWFDSAQCYIIDYLLLLRGMWEDLGIRENDIMFITNDGVSDIPMRDILMWDGFKKNIPGLSTLDIYAKMWPTNGHIMDIPFSADYFVKLFEYSSDKIRSARGYSLGVEIQGGWWIKPPDVVPQETDMLLAKLLGHGLDGIGVYVMRGGYNIDNSVYDFQAPIDTEGVARGRYDVLSKYGKNVICPYGETLMASEDVGSPIAVASYWPYINPQAGVQEDMDYFYAYESAGLFGMLVSAGFNPDVIDLRIEDPGNLSKYKAIFFLNPGYIGTDDLAKLEGYVANGGNLINFLWPGEKDLQWKNDPDNALFVDDLFPGEFIEQWDWWYPPFGDHLDFNLDQETGSVWGYNYQTSWDLTDHPECVPFITDRSDNVVGYYTSHGSGCAYFIGTYLSADYNTDKYYEMGEEDIREKSRLLGIILDRCGVDRSVYSETPFHEVWARKPRNRENEIFIFTINSKDICQEINIEFENLSALGLYPDINYRAVDILGGEELGNFTGQMLKDDGITVTREAYSASIIRLAATFEIQLRSGWNLISLPIMDERVDVESALEGITGKFDIVQTFDPWDAGDRWQVYHPYRDEHFNDLISVGPETGHWVHLPEDEDGASLTLEGSTAKNYEIPLKKGWNLVGFPSLTPLPVCEVLEEIPLERIQLFGGGTPGDLEDMTWGEMMLPGNAYWIKVTMDCSLSMGS